MAVEPRLKLEAELEDGGGLGGARLLEDLVDREAARLVAQPQATHLHIGR